MEQSEQDILTRWQEVRYNLLHGFFYTLSLLPMWFLYVLSDIVFPFVYHIAHYRRKMVRHNLFACFPEKSSRELKCIEREFYHWLCDYVFETIKLTSMSEAEMKRHIRFDNVELPERMIREKKSVVLMLGHYCNWEWVSSIPIHLKYKEPEYMPYQIYHPIENPVVNKLFKSIRTRMGVHNISMNNTLRVIMRTRQEGIPSITGFIADQAPHWYDIHLWTDFLNHPDTPFFIGGERIAKKLDFTMIYLDVRRERRGVYVATYQMMTEEPRTYKDYELTEMYAQMLEQSIRRQPAYWLWTHNRWKRTREEFQNITDPSTGKLQLQMRRHRKKVLLSFDTEEFDVPREHGVDYDTLKEGMEVSIEGTNRILDVLRDNDARATFFCTANFAEHAPEVMHRIVAEGHEVACHGVDHLQPQASDVFRSKEIVERVTGLTVHGYRQPRMFPVSDDDIRAAGYTYNSSLNPAFIPGRYMHLTAPRTWFMKDSVMQIPASVTPWVRFPLFWLSLHNLPERLYHWLACRTLKHDGYLVTYFHPWEFYELSKHPELRMPFIIRNHSGQQMCNRLARLIQKLRTTHSDFITFSEFVQLKQP